MLFSSDKVASYINAAFEPVWESVRPVPIVTIDFGNGNKITRTLHGNIATYLCNWEGDVYDILPGIYTADEYLNQLQQFTLLFRHSLQGYQPKAKLTEEQYKAEIRTHALARVKAYHERQAARLKQKQPVDVFVRAPNGGRGKELIEMQIELIAAGDAAKLTRPGNPPGSPGALPPNGSPARPVAADPVPTNPEDLVNWKELVEDTQINESTRRRMIHEKLVATGAIKPAEIKKWLYREVLHADLDDPTLGVGAVLNKRYPFAAEDEAIKKK